MSADSVAPVAAVLPPAPMAARAGGEPLGAAESSCCRFGRIRRRRIARNASGITVIALDDHGRPIDRQVHHAVILELGNDRVRAGQAKGKPPPQEPA